MMRLNLLALAGAMACGVSIATAQTSPAGTDRKVAAVKPSLQKTSTPSRKAVQSQAEKPAAEAESAEPLSQAQLDVVPRVLTGKADCEFNQSVSVQPLAGKPGMFKVGYRNDSYTMVPQATTTGAVRLEDKKAGVVWLQIPSKSMLMNSKIGQRMVDACMHDEQRAAVNAVTAAGRASE